MEESHVAVVWLEGLGLPEMVGRDAQKHVDGAQAKWTLCATCRRYRRLRQGAQWHVMLHMNDACRWKSSPGEHIMALRQHNEMIAN
eukprot:1564313-Amphidinium_carterae.1